MGMTNGDWMHAYTFANDSLTSARDRIRDLEAQLAEARKQQAVLALGGEVVDA